ncbi:MAG: rRNA maturation RNase YbeY [Gammaproteobacteria bacterium]|nr:rRNA maturation RNase YbeY [Gammaproteobacteria bacterium]
MVADGVPSEDIPEESLFARWVTIAQAALAVEGEVCIQIVSSNESQALNRDYRSKDYPTNVLSFPADLPVEFGVMGDLAICWDVVLREAAEQSKTVNDHLAHMVVHGVLHLAGLDHLEDEQAEAMEQIERDVLAQFDIADPYLTPKGD